MPPYSVDELRRIIAPIAQEHGVKSGSLFGSYSRGTASVDSDVDLKIEKGRLSSLFQLSGFRLAVEDALKLSVDLVTSGASDHAFLDSNPGCRLASTVIPCQPPAKASGPL